MQLRESEHGDGSIDIRNVGGIERTTVDFSPGVTILVGRNATNRTSFLQALMAALGSENVTIKGDAEEAEVELTLGEQTYTRTLTRRAGDVATDGHPYLGDPELADLFAFLLESNEARRAIATDGDLRELIMRPVDTDRIQAEIERLVDRRESLNEELAAIDDRKSDLPELEQRRGRLQEDIEAKRADLEATEEELEVADGDIEAKREETSELEETLDRLRRKRSELDDVRYDLDTERESLDALKRERNELATEYEKLPDTPVGDVEELDAELRRLREGKQRLESEVSELQTAIDFNEGMLDDVESGPFAGLSADGPDRPTDRLLDDGELTCWTCGSEVDPDQIETTVDQLRELSRSKIGELNELTSDIDELQSEKREYQNAQRERDRLERRLDALDDDIDDTERTIRQLRERREELTAEVESIEADVDAMEDDDYSELLELHREANQLEYELGKLETELERVEDNISSMEAQIDAQDDVEAELEEVNEGIEALRTKIGRIERDAIERFNEQMDTILTLLEYANLDRIWIERVEREVRQGRQTVTQSAFELHVVRSSESGVAYEDTVEHLSESEREVTGLVFALAGYLTHQVYEEVPFILLDSLEAIDAERIAALVEYFIEYTGYLVIALLPEDAAALPEEYERITEI